MRVYLLKTGFGKIRLYNGIEFAFSELANADDRIADIRSRLLANPIRLYFETDERSLSLSKEQRQDFADLIYYLDHVENSKLEISGHTDKEGELKYNIKLSKDRAGFIRDYLNNRGSIATDRMEVKGYGPNKPIATNRTEEGRAKNRRVDVTLKGK